MSAAQILWPVRQLLREVLEARTQGDSERRLRTAHAFVDGYMRALLDAGLATRQQLLVVVAEERARLAGPAVGELEDDGFDGDEGQLPVHAPPAHDSGVRPRREREVRAQSAPAALRRGAA